MSDLKETNDLKEKELLMEIAIGKGMMKKMPSYLEKEENETVNKKDKKTIVEETLFD